MPGHLPVAFTDRGFRVFGGLRLSLMIAFLLPVLANAEYRIPSADSREASPPQVTGKILEISGNIIIVQSSSKEVSVLTGFETHFFTTYGGVLKLNELCPDSRLDVWYPRPDDNIRIATAVSIKVPKSC